MTTSHSNAAKDLVAILADASPEVAAANAHQVQALAADAAAEMAAIAPPARGRAAQAKASTPTEHEANGLAAKFEHLWQEWGGPELIKEYRFHVSRRWRFDYYHEPTKTAVELEGGLYSGGRHTRADGFRGDIEKYNAAAMQGITVLRLGTGQVDAAHVAEIADYVNRRIACIPEAMEV